MANITAELGVLADKYARELDSQIATRVEEMEEDDKSHYLIYRVLGILRSHR